MDANGDGIGDLRGIASRLDYLADLGIDAVWLSPIFPSPMIDLGYDVSDYCGVNPEFGTLEDLDALVRALHQRGMKLLLDLVPNHTSDRHPWFVESRAGRASAKRDWYLWRDPAPGGGPPNNWMSVFGGSAWELDRASGQYYYHAYLKEQPDLNWRNPAVEAAMHDVVRFWLARGVDGFRVDVIWHLIKDALFRDNDPNPEWREGQPDARKVLPTRTTDQPEVHATIARLRRVFDAFPERVMVGEIYLPPERLAAYYGTPAAPECHLPFNFSLLWPAFDWRAEALAATIRRYEAALPAWGWPNWVAGNHDVTRIATRVGPRQAAVAAVLLLTLRGTPTIYQGDELGLENVAIPPERVTDGRERTQPGYGRDPVRTPMPWSADARGGFSAGEPWLPLNADLATRNVASLSADPRSILSLHRRLLALRRAEPSLHAGDVRDVRAEGDVLRYRRDRLEIALNLAARPASIVLAAPFRIALSTDPAREGARVSGSFEL
ncbi:MAG TPA: alpha-amylase family glycosyl hydrolase, partial [bacterium]|nr:alpha-amylase family glycosyl hydrolase [bacterium]